MPRSVTTRKAIPRGKPSLGSLGAAILQMKGSFFTQEMAEGVRLFLYVWIQSEGKLVHLCLGPNMVLVTPRGGNGGRKFPPSLLHSVLLCRRTLPGALI